MTDGAELDRLLDGAKPPSMEVLRKQACELFRERLQSLEQVKTNNPERLRRVISEAVGELTFATGIIGTQDEATRVAKAISKKVARLGLSNEFYWKLVNVMAPLDESANITRADIVRCLTEQLTYLGKPLGAREQAEEILKMAQENPNIALIEAMVFLINSTLLLDADPDGSHQHLAYQLLTILNYDVNDQSEEKYMLLGALHSVLATRAMAQGDMQTTFQHGAYAYRIGRKHSIIATQINGLLHMGKAALMSGPRYHRTALRCFKAAYRLSRKSGDVVRAALAEMNIGAYFFRAGQYRASERTFMHTARLLNANGMYKGESLLYMGLSELYLGKYPEARATLVEAKDVFKHYKVEYYALEAQHGLAYAEHMAGNYEVAIRHYNDAIAAAEMLNDLRVGPLLKNLRGDLATCELAFNGDGGTAPVQ